jgi:hypothetical protein
METLARTLADGLVLIHVAFVLFVVFGGLLVLRWRWVMGLHVPAAVWGALVELFSWECPLTPLENELRHQAGQAGYAGGFIEHYVVPILYPAGLGRESHVVIGSLVVVLNALVYEWALRRSRRTATGPARSSRDQQTDLVTPLRGITGPLPFRHSAWSPDRTWSIPESEPHAGSAGLAGPRARDGENGRSSIPPHGEQPVPSPAGA